MKSKILIGLVLGALVTTTVGHGKEFMCYSKEEFIKKFPNKHQLVKYKGMNEKQKQDAMNYNFANYTGAKWSNRCLGGVNDGGNVPLGAGVPSVHIGCGSGDKATKYKLKIIVKQKKPCYVMLNKKFLKDTTRKIDSHTIEVIPKDKVWCDVFLTGRVGTDYKYKPLKNVINILGNNVSCLKQENSETWEIYYDEGDKWKLLAKERFEYTNQHWVFSSKPNATKKAHVANKTTNKKKQETRIRIRIYKYGAPDGFGRTFNSASDCEAERVKLTESHKGLDYEYKCEKK